MEEKSAVSRLLYLGTEEAVKELKSTSRTRIRVEDVTSEEGKVARVIDRIERNLDDGTSVLRANHGKSIRESDAGRERWKSKEVLVDDLCCREIGEREFDPKENLSSSSFGV
uniref:Uncharacterized protein n=1 Tax=Vespula pensylvanica TaxID=30213 RepID=A0A834PFG2_VESPE|nr:hypothetical protein H0235_001229 [Vespula pensylvanica]